jgi:hypothetical protein
MVAALVRASFCLPRPIPTQLNIGFTLYSTIESLRSVERFTLVPDYHGNGISAYRLGGEMIG